MVLLFFCRDVEHKTAITCALVWTNYRGVGQLKSGDKLLIKGGSGKVSQLIWQAGSIGILTSGHSEGVAQRKGCHCNNRFEDAAN
jgi:NADPH:quinone reductase-like Zn-dependent oxidoreductase